MKLENKVAVVTGAAGGIGQEIVKVFVEEGAQVLAVDRDLESLEDLLKQFEGKVTGLKVDVTDFSEVSAMMDQAVNEFGTLDIVVNNAGIASGKPLLEHDPKTDFEAITDVNQKGVYHGLIAGGRKLVALGKPGVILNTSSIYAQFAAERTFTYNVSKAAVDMMTKCAALEYAPHNIRVVAVAPGRVDTPMLQGFKAVGLWDQVRSEQMRNEITQPREIACVFAFLASDAANCINGSTVAAEDGYLGFKLPLVPNP